MGPDSFLTYLLFSQVRPPDEPNLASIGLELLLVRSGQRIGEVAVFMEFVEEGLRAPVGFARGDA